MNEPEQKYSKMVIRVGQLFDYLVEHPQGGTTPELMEHLGLATNARLRQVIRELRLLLGETEDINLVCDKPGAPGPWTYRLVGTVEEIHEWQSFNLRYLDARIKTCRAMARSIVKATDGRKKDGRRARLYDRHLGRLLEDLVDLETSVE